MRQNNELKKIINILQEKDSLFLGSLNKLKQKRHLKSSKKEKIRSYWYLTWKEGGRSKATYIPSKNVAHVARGIENMKRVKNYLSHVAMENLKRMKEDRDVRKSR